MLEGRAGIVGAEETEGLVSGESFLELQVSLELTMLALLVIVSINKFLVVWSGDGCGSEDFIASQETSFRLGQVNWFPR